MEQKEIVETNILAQVAKILKVPVEAFENFDEEAAIAYINTFNDNSSNNGTLETTTIVNLHSILLIKWWNFTSVCLSNRGR